MMIRINHPDGRFDLVKASRLDYLIQTVQVSRFKRNSGWVVIGRDPVRNQNKRAFHFGAERRDPEMPGLC
jgi:hypothetical protein